MQRIAIERFLTEVVQRSVPIFPYDARAAQWHAAERAASNPSGEDAFFFRWSDRSHRRRHQLTLVITNVSDFALFEELHVVHWRQDAL